ncbi:terminase small subunit [Deinococcus cavernae]|uniref:Terminase small subunit n=1 Tax=Deinococcus cavernae TaxID=2320857 RepID=A0A418V6G1_9DEIO|nr:terminase small subunit [Deinococcus cavernae]RJF71698.1 terminase small subunit [Deinococcus cavernae]
MPRKKPAPPRPANAGAGSAKKKPEVKLTDRQRLFCENLNRGVSNTEAAIKAGYSEKWARQQAGKLVDKTLHPHVVAYLDELREASRSKSVADGQEIRETLSGILRDEVEDVATGGKDLEWAHLDFAYLKKRHNPSEVADGRTGQVQRGIQIGSHSAGRRA